MNKLIRENRITKEELLVDETIFSVANGYLGTRGTFVEGYGSDFEYNQTYLNGFYDYYDYFYEENFKGFPQKGQKIVNLIDGQKIEVIINKVPLNISNCEVVSLKREYDLEKGITIRNIKYRTLENYEFILTETKLVSTEFKELIDRFYNETTHVLAHSRALIGRLGGDEVKGFYVPGFAGKQFARRSVEAAQNLLRVTGHADPKGPWVPVGVGINTGTAYYGAVSSADGLVELTALGDAVNVAARLASQAAAGEVVISKSTALKAGIDTNKLEKRTLDLKGKSEPIDVWVMRVVQK